MKTLFTFLFLNASVLLSAQPTAFDDPIAYNDFIIGEQDKINEKISAFMDEFENGTETSVREKHTVLKHQIDASLKALRGLPPFQGDSALRDVAINLITFYESVCINEYVKVIDLLMSGKYSVEQQREVNFIFQDISQREKHFDILFAAAQDEFASKHNFNLQEKNQKD